MNELIQNEIARIVELQGIDSIVLEEFAQFVVENCKKKLPKKPSKKSLTLTQLKLAVYQHFNVADTSTLKKSGAFQMATNGMEKLELGKKEGWEILYRKFIGVLPEEENETGYGCVNGISIFKYDLPWRAFGLNSQTASTDDVKSAYRELSKIYHPDIPETGNAEVFSRLTIFYKSLTERF
ncbi:molecular chaperone DnaJ [Cyanobacteria bacterium FACHB-DQ100]|nr:molecular chaperone DnaJ [Cyanobacteria bacterium FACHB-DQ100]